MHYHFIEDDSGNVIDLVPFCSDACHRAWCADHGITYGGWNGCHEGSDSVEFCANCGTVAGGAYECNCQSNNVVVNRFISEHGEQCEHGHWIQLPENQFTSAYAEDDAENEE
jgi:hypothetical protein